jgi:hypothetical protein
MCAVEGNSLSAPRTFYGWEADGKFYVSLWPKGDPKQRGANVYASKAEAETECITKRTDRRNGAPTIVWATE